MSLKAVVSGSSDGGGTSSASSALFDCQATVEQSLERGFSNREREREIGNVPVLPKQSA